MRLDCRWLGPHVTFAPVKPAGVPGFRGKSSDEWEDRTQALPVHGRAWATSSYPNIATLTVVAVLARAKCVALARSAADEITVARVGILHRAGAPFRGAAGSRGVAGVDGETDTGGADIALDTAHQSRVALANATHAGAADVTAGVEATTAATGGAHVALFGRTAGEARVATEVTRVAEAPLSGAGKDPTLTARNCTDAVPTDA